MSPTEVATSSQSFTAKALPSEGRGAAVHTVIRPPGRWRGVGLKEIWGFRDLLLVFGIRDIKLRYRQTVLGVVWVVLQPLIAAAIFALIFGRVARLPSEGVPYFLFAYASFLAWTAFQSTLSRSSASLVQNSQLVSKVYFPRLILPFSTGLLALLDFVVGFALLAVLFPAYGRAPGWAIVLVPVWLALLLLLALGLGMMGGALMVRYRDVQHALPVAVQFLLYASPVGYSLSAVPEAYRHLFLLNPLTGLLEAFRWSLVGTAELHIGHVSYSAGATLLIFVFGVFQFHRLERDFADVI